MGKGARKERAGGGGDHEPGGTKHSSAADGREDWTPEIHSRSAWTRKTVLFASAGMTCAVGGMIFNDVLLLVLAMVMICVLIFTFATTQADVAVERVIGEPRAFEKDRVPVRLHITNRGRSLGMVEVFDRLPPVMEVVRGSNRGTFSLDPGETAYLDYAFSCPLRGYYMVGPSILRRSDFLGIFSEDLVASARTHVTVYPRMSPARDVALSSRYRKVHPGSITTRSLGHGSDFHSIREYVSTDPFKRINWKVTARTRQLMVNQYDTDDVFDAMILVDARDISRVGTTLQNPLEYSVKAAATLARTLTGRTNRVALVTYGDGVRVIHHGSGESHTSTILSTLTGTYARGETTLKEAFDTASPYITPRSPVILFSPLDGDESVNEIAGYLTTTGHHFTVVSPSAVDFERMIDGAYSPRYLMVRLERENLLNELRGRGAQVIDWAPTMSVESVLREVV